MGNKCVARLTGNTVVTLSEKAFCGSNFTAYVADGAKVVTSAEVIDPDAKNATFIVSSSEPFGAYTAPAQKAGAALRINGDSYGLRKCPKN